MKRYDVERGFMIMCDGLPYQAMRRVTWYYELGRLGVTSEYWLRGSPMSEEMHAFVFGEFSAVLIEEFKKRQGL